MKKLFFSLLILITVLSWHISFAQQIGDFSIGFPSPDTLLTEDSVHIFFHVPNSYQQNIPSKMIVGIHGAGNPKTPETIRNYFSPTGDSLNTIIVCPKPYLGDQSSSKMVINITIDSVLQWYNIDTNEIYIAGYSAGSDVASKYTLESPQHKLKGLIWYAPGFFFKPELSSLIEFPPTCLCYGDLDPISNILGQVTSIRDSFAHSPFDFFYNEIPGVSHTMEFYHFTQEMIECLRFIDDPENFIPDSSYVGIRSITHETLNLYPNPTEGKMFLGGIDVNEKGNLKVMDLFRRTVLERTDFQYNQSINLTGQKPGTYIVSFQTNSTTHFGRVVLIP